VAVQDLSGREKRRARAGAGTVGGYVGFAFGLLAVLSTASEVSTPAPGDAAVMVLIFMILGYAAGWFLQPLLAQLFPQP
jgi:hypothetical protein